ncbi:MAG: preprotein translocase subunit SecG [Firmicutes bacterium]|nr:preprotein translocase subunit SecG [Bacillota bacterium]
MKTVFMVLLAIIAIVLILAVMFQQGNSNGLSALSGSSDTAFKKKARGYDEKLSKLTIICAVAFLVVNLILLALM